MALSSMQYKRRLVELGTGLGGVADDLYAAVNKGATSERRAELVAAARTKIDQFRSLLADVKEVNRAEIEGSYGDTVREIESYLGTLDGNDVGTR